MELTAKYTVERAIRDHQRFIMGQCLYFAKDKDAAEELQSSVFEKVWLARDKFNGKQEDFRKWVTVVIKNIHTDSYRRDQSIKRKHYKADVEKAVHLSSAENTERTLESKDSLQSILYTVEFHFPFARIYRIVFEARYLHERTYKEIAQELHLSMQEVKQILNKLREFFRPRDFVTPPANIRYVYTKLYTPSSASQVIYGVQQRTGQTYFYFE